jgi:hypothetical protein
VLTRFEWIPDSVGILERPKATFIDIEFQQGIETNLICYLAIVIAVHSPICQCHRMAKNKAQIERPACLSS